MGRQRTIILTSSDGTTAKTILPMIKTLVIASAIAGLSVATAPEPPDIDVTIEPTAEVTKIPVVKKEWKCEDCTPEEKYVLKELQEHTRISDRNALATIMGNIKQESKFISNICEGGARVTYENCHAGGYGLIQWTSIGRYNALGNFCDKYLSLIHI
mgnify:FL=1